MSGKNLVVDIDFFGKGLTIDAYAEAVLTWSNKNLVGQSIYCNALRNYVNISKNKLKHTVNHKKHQRPEDYNHEILAVVSVLKELLQTADHRYS